MKPPDEATAERWLDESINGLARAHPEMSAQTTLTRGQRECLTTGALVLLGAVLLSPRWAGIVVLGVINLCYAVAVGYRVLALRAAMRGTGTTDVPDDVARAIPDGDLPSYTVLLPAYQEPQIVAELLAGVGRLDYPRDKLEVLLLLEADDHVTIDAARAAGVEAVATIVEVPAAEPRTKPKACNYGLFLATGDIVTIYDAEDQPDPLQLRRVASIFAESGPDLACVQARLGYRNESQNLLTGWFSVEYDTWFGLMLPGIVALGAPLPLGGTSNHIRADLLREVGAWDPFNVTEDADLGIRLARRGYRSTTVASTTLEEANSDPINWARQRSRWNKGYMQTALIHLRSPRLLASELGRRGFFGFCVLLVGTPLLALITPMAWLLSAVWWLGAPDFIPQIFPTWLLDVSIANLVGGNFFTLYANLVSVRELRKPHLLPAVLTMPLYWVLMAVGGIKAFVQLITAPSYWEKTAHGLDQPTEPPG
jgi:cellulose synthase/poly-beta-1,6-N-acetylglucosamine synthase-like glycosyltransferase